MGVGYARAAKLIDALEGAGIIGPANGSKPREILAGPQAGSKLAQTSEELEEAADELLGEEDR
jgi:DNA segregation ATPase FtsK/SpoIIIE-like protein